MLVLNISFINLFLHDAWIGGRKSENSPLPSLLQSLVHRYNIAVTVVRILGAARVSKKHFLCNNCAFLIFFYIPRSGLALVKAIAGKECPLSRRIGAPVQGAKAGA
jgi:hypothetical protein